ncbi:FAST kinase domain-containing protein 5, mitochondrial isoform X1 [Phymastichus coffea]|uniref:FAST kinase domain-containing protein 5, mitochondrial isoform X1 n=1 Tax=Phymastichus coffea TaxID=108790 RepID=UPI00273ABA8B|nr:FAST kinase domain-containing protein 5, mitochondrial isoform X1 [Phymastichus coffea]
MIRRLAKLPLTPKSRLLIAKFSGLIERDEKQTRKRINLLRTEMFVQDGFEIYELPIIINVACDLKSIFGNADVRDSSNAERSDSGQSSNLSRIDGSSASPSREKLSNESNDSLPVFPSELEFSRILELEHAFREIDSSSAGSAKNPELSGKIAVQHLRKVVDFEKKNRRFKRFMPAFDRDSFILHMLDSVVSGSDSGLIIDALQVLLRDRFNSANNPYKDMLTDQLLIRATSGNFSVDQLISIIKILYAFNDTKYRQAIDYLWIGFVIKQEDISIDQLVSLLKLLKYLARSKNRMQMLLEKKLMEHYEEMSVAQVNDLLNALANNLQSAVALKCASKWAYAHLATASKYDLMEFLENLTTNRYVDATLVEAIEKTLTMKNVKSNDYALMVAVAIYCSTVHLRNGGILNKVVKYLEKHAKNVPVSPFMKMISAFGTLNFKLEKKESIWEIFEIKLKQEFSHLQADAILSTFLSCAYTSKYFPEFMTKILAPEFLQQLDLQIREIESAKSLREQLYLLDTAMSVECSSYLGPLLIRRRDRYYAAMHPKIESALSQIRDELARFANEDEAISERVLVDELSNSQLYLVHAVIHKRAAASAPLSRLDRFSANRRGTTAVLLLLPEHYCWNSTELTGQQAMKVRHLTKLGFRVALLDCRTLLALRERPAEALREYLTRSFRGSRRASSAADLR